MSENKLPSQTSAVRLLRNMRGGAQAKLVECEDGHAYVVKFSNNPQGRRTLVNEVIASELLAEIGLPVPTWRAVRFDAGWLRENPISLQFGARSVGAVPGLHFGSRYCQSPSPGGGVYDFLPTPVLRLVRPLPEFLGVYVADQWMSNRDKRQAIFCRSHGQGWKVSFIDHGHVFGGASWDFVDAFGWGTYWDTVVYSRVRTFAEIQDWITRVAKLADRVLVKAWRSVPAAWVEGEEDELQRLMTQLAERKNKLNGIVERLLEHPLSPFQLTDGLAPRSEKAIACEAT